MTHLQFVQPHWLWIGSLCCGGAVALMVRAGRQRRRTATALAGTRFSTTVSGPLRLLKQALTVLGVGATFVALARPVAGFRYETERRDGIDLMFAVDTSKSMLASDLRPDRLTRAKLAVSDLVREFPGERVGLIAFAGEAFVEVPMTIDHAIFREGLEVLDTDIIPRGGTDIASPIRAATAAMATEPARRKLLVILSDGEDLQGEAQAAAKEAAAAGLVIYTVGVGTQAGELIPVAHDGQGDVMRDADGQPVRSRLDEPALRGLAQITGGAYAPLGPSGRGLEAIYRQHLANLPRRTVEERTHKVYTERFQIPLALAIGCLMLELALGERRRDRGYRTTRAAAAHRRSDIDGGRGRLGVAGAAAGLVLWLVAGVRSAAAAPTPAEPAATAPAQPTAPVPPTAAATGVSAYNDGTSAYRKKDFIAARDQFQAATHTTDLPMQADAYYNLGDTRYRMGQTTLAKDRRATMDAWKGALAAYDGALALRPRDGDARFNRDLVARRLAALEEQDRQDQQKKNNEGQQNKKPDQGKSSSGQGQGQGQSQGKDQKDQGQPGKDESKSGGGSPQESAEHGQPAPKSQGEGKGEDPNGKESHGKGHDQSDGQGSGQTKAHDQAQRGAPASAATPSSREIPKGAREAAAPDEQAHAEPPRGPGVVSGPSGSSQGADQSAGVRRAPGALSASEATQLLDSVSGELRRMPVASGRRQQPVNRDGSPIKDW